MTSRTSPRRSTSASSVCSTMNSALIAKMPTTTRATAMIVRSRRFTIPSSLTTAQRRDGGHRRLRRRRLAGGGPGRGRCTRRSGAAAQGGQRQIGKHAVPALGRFVDDYFIAVLKDLLHGLEIQPLEGHVLRHLEGAIDRGETIGITLSAGDDFLAKGFRLLLDCH